MLVIEHREHLANDALNPSLVEVQQPCNLANGLMMNHETHKARPLGTNSTW